jgi:hypothetical protein
MPVLEFVAFYRGIIAFHVLVCGSRTSLSRGGHALSSCNSCTARSSTPGNGPKWHLPPPQSTSRPRPTRSRTPAHDSSSPPTLPPCANMRGCARGPRRPQPASPLCSPRCGPSVAPSRPAEAPRHPRPAHEQRQQPQRRATPVAATMPPAPTRRNQPPLCAGVGGLAHADPCIWRRRQTIFPPCTACTCRTAAGS